MYAKKKNSRKSVVALLAVVLVIGIAAGGTLAWLMDSTDPVTNTFTVGDIDIELAEMTGKDYKIVPGGKSEKDPTVTVESGSEKCYVYVLVENNVVLNGNAVATPNIDSTKWTTVQTDGNKTLYRYYQIVDATSADIKCPVFTEVSYSDTITKGDINTLENKTIVITAFAHQSDNITDATVADDAAKTHFGFTNANP